MMKFRTLATMLTTLTLAVTPLQAPEHKALVTKIHEDDQITVLAKHKGRVKEVMLHGYDFSIPVELAENIPTETATGKFALEFSGIFKDDDRTYYQFRSYDNETWWALTEDDIGFVPSYDKEYTILYCANGTTKDNKPCDCIPEWECECELYDDVFIAIFEN